MDASLRTRDLAFAAALATLGFKVTKTEREGRQVYWTFTGDEDEFRRTKDAWEQDTLHVRAFAYSEQMKRFKGSVFQAADEPAVIKRRKA